MVNRIGRIAKNNANSPMGSNIATLRYRYGIDFNGVSPRLMRKCISEHHKETVSTINQGNVIMELLHVRYGCSAMTPSGFSDDDLTMMIQHICTE